MFKAGRKRNSIILNSLWPVIWTVSALMLILYLLIKEQIIPSVTEWFDSEDNKKWHNLTREDAPPESNVPNPFNWKDEYLREIDEESDWYGMRNLGQWEYFKIVFIVLVIAVVSIFLYSVCTMNRSRESKTNRPSRVIDSVRSRSESSVSRTASNQRR